MRIKSFILAAALSTTALSAFAVEEFSNDKTRDYYIQFNTGYAHGMKPGENFTGSSMGNSALFGLEAGYRFDEHIRASLSFDYMPSFDNKSTSTAYVTLPVSVLTTTTQNKIKVRSYVTMANLYYDIDQFDKFTPYLTIGAGIAINKAGQYTQNSADSLGNSYLTTTNAANKTNFAYKLGFGTRYALTNAFDLDFRYQYQDLGKFRAGTATTTNGANGVVTTGSVSTQQGKLRSQEILVGVAYKF